MYIPKHFAVTDDNEVFRYLDHNGFGQLISQVEGRLFVTHLPFLLNDAHTALFGHIAKRNPQWQNIEQQEVLVTFQGPHDYISPQWYLAPGVPTWNYQAVHVYGRCRVIHDEEQLRRIVESLTAKYEAAFEQPWQPEYSDKLLKVIVGLEVTITEIQTKYKLNQNRSEQDQQRVIEMLRIRGSAEVAKAMDEHK